jgi:adenylylsulfate kinase
MNSKSENIHPFNGLLARESKEQLLTQKAKVFWLTGLSGSGKSTLAKELEQQLHEAGYLVAVLDGDNVRAGINNNLGFSEEDRLENIRRIAEVSKLFVQTGVIVIACFVSPTIEIRSLAKSIVSSPDFLEVFIDTPIEECEKRDVKGLYAKARKGEIKDFTGINAPFEAPVNADITIQTAGKTIAESTSTLFQFAINHIKL